MVSVLVQDLDRSVKRRFAEQAERHERSMGVEARDILTKDVARPSIGLALTQAAQEAGGADDLSAPKRDDVARTGQTLT